MEVRKGYKQTEIGIIPTNWEIVPFESLCRTFTKQTGFDYSANIKPTLITEYKNGFLPFIQNKDFEGKKVNYLTDYFIPEKVAAKFPNILLDEKCLLISISGSIGNVSVFSNLQKAFIGGAIAVGKFINQENLDWVMYYLQSYAGQGRLFDNVKAGSHHNLTLEDIRRINIPIPPEREHKQITSSLSDADALIESMEQFIAKKRQVKQGAMQELLAGKRRLPGFSEEWETKTLEELTDCLDNLRVPLNETQRMKMQGDYPYCGANGTLDYVNSYVIDDDFILIAEDGGYFDEYATRPIAYKMSGKCWVNNHAHILKAKENIDQNFIFYSLVNKNILPFLANGTRAKLNKSEMYKVELIIPSEQKEQTAIAEILSDMDAEIAALEGKLVKAWEVKQGMMSELLTGRIRLI